MKLGLYSFAALILMVLVGAFIHTLELGSYRLELINIQLPVSVWVILPALVLFFFTVIHMIFYGFRNYLQIKKWRRDTQTLEDALYWSLVKEPKEQKYSIPEMGTVASLLNKSSLNILGNIDGLSPRLSKAVNIIEKIHNGEYIDLKEEKMSKIFHDGNPILINNRLNRMRNDEKFVIDVMKSSSRYSEVVQKEALTIFAKNESFEHARKYVKVFDIESFFVILNRVSKEDNLGLSQDILNEFISELKPSCANFISIAKVTKIYFKPDENLALFLEYQKKNEKAQNAYLYLLFEYELIDQVGIYLAEQEKDEFVKFRALYTLKKSNKNYKLEDLIDVYSVCNDNKYL